MPPSKKRGKKETAQPQRKAAPDGRPDLRPVLMVAIILLSSYAYFFYVWANWNVNTRLALTHAIVDRGTLTIDAYHELTEDKALYNGHYYCDKAVGASFLGVPVYWAYRKVAGPSVGSVEERSLRGIKGNYFISLFTTAVPSVIAGVLLFLLLGYFTPLVAPRVWLTLAYGLGTLAFPYATMFFGHQTAAALGFISFFILFRMRKKGWSVWWALPAGVLAGYAVITDFFAFVIMLGLVAYVAASLWREAEMSRGMRLLFFAAFCIGVALPLPLQLWYNWACFGDPLTSAYKYEVLTQFREGMSQGLMGITAPKIEALYQLTFGPRRGIFYGSPFLLYLFPGAYLMIKRREYRREAWLCLGVGAATLLLNSGYYLWWGGAAYGARFMIVALPFLALPGFFAYPINPRAFKILAGGSIVFTFIVVIAAGPQIAEGSPNPLWEGAFQTMLKEYLHPEEFGYWINFNLMMYLGVDDLRSVLPIIGFLAICLLYLRSLRLDQKMPRKI